MQRAFSSSLSTLMSVLAFRIPFSRSLAPYRPVSSSRVTSTSRGPCLMVLSARIAKQLATPIPSSAPSEVWVAFRYFPSIRGMIGSFEKSIVIASSAWHTISIWHWRQTVDLFSQPIPNIQIHISTGMSRLSDDQIITSIHVGLTSKLFSSLLQICKDLLVTEGLSLLIGSTRNLSDLQEIFPNRLRFGKLSIQVV